MKDQVQVSYFWSDKEKAEKVREKVRDLTNDIYSAKLLIHINNTIYSVSFNFQAFERLATPKNAQ
jgi:hypothetical protein